MEPQSVRILGIRFFAGPVPAAVESMQRSGGFLIAPSGTCFARLRVDQDYRDAVTNADLALADSGAMVLLSRLIVGRPPTRISGLAYLRHLAASNTLANGLTLWVLPSAEAKRKTENWLKISHSGEHEFYVAPWYRDDVQDSDLVALINARCPKNVIVAIGSGPQEKLGRYLRDNITSRPAIHCIGAALGFLTGDQVAIPAWADRFYLGWLVRLFAQPRVFIPRLARAAVLPWMMLRYRSELPPLRAR